MTELLYNNTIAAFNMWVSLDLTLLLQLINFVNICKRPQCVIGRLSLVSWDLKSILDHWLKFKSTLIATSNELSLVSYVYANWGGDLADKKPVYGHYLLLKGNPIVWSSKMKHFICRSTAKQSIKPFQLIFERLCGLYPRCLN